MFTIPNVLTIAGSDSGGGAGIQADLKTMEALGVYGMSVITALTAQNGLGVSGIFAATPEFVALQLATVREGFKVKAAKTGMLFSTGIIEAVAAALAERDFPLVVDPVCVSQSGHQLLEESAVASMRQKMLPLADLLTPNRPEAELLSGVEIKDEAGLKEAGRRLLDMGAKAVLIKGGHYEEKPILVTDWLFTIQGEEALRQPHVDTANNHGTGCTLSAAIASFLALDLPLKVAVTNAQQYLNVCLRHGYAPGKGAGPVNHRAGRK